MNGTLQERLDWLRKNQPKNAVALNAIESKLGLPLTQLPPKKQKSSINWGEVVSKENKWLRECRRFLPGHGPNRA